MSQTTEQENRKQNQNPETRERRFVSEGIELRDGGERGSRIVGYAAVFNSFSEDLGGFKEIIRPGAFRDAISTGQDVRGLYNHDPNMVLGRTAAGTLRLSEDKKGLRYEIDAPDTQQARDLTALLKRGDVSGSSFAFTVRGTDGDDWRQEGDVTIREIRSVDLYDVGPVTYPAYTATVSEAAKRSLERFRETTPPPPKTFPIREKYKQAILQRENKEQSNGKSQ